jgi:hypothetical protein
MSSFAKKMKLQLAGLVAGVAMAAAGTPASAAVLILYDSVTHAPAPSPITGNFAGEFGTAHVSGAPSDAVAGLDASSATADPFTDTLTFDVAGLTDGTAGLLSTFRFSGLGDIDFSSIALDGDTTLITCVNGAIDVCGGVFSGLTAGTHTITIKGTTTGTTSDPASYVGDLNLDVAPVPEPATWGMMLLGFGIVGAGMRSRKRTMVLA